MLEYLLLRRGLRLITLTAQCYETRYAELAPTFKKVPGLGLGLGLG